MRFFLCASGGSTVAIPIAGVASLTLYEREAECALSRDNDGNTYFSLPHLFGVDQKISRHGMVLKNNGDEDSGVFKNRQVILTESVEREVDIPEDKIFPLPRALKNVETSQIFFGITCALNDMRLQGEGSVLFIDPLRLTLYMCRVCQCSGAGDVP
jgi:hypothetical protein